MSIQNNPLKKKLIEIELALKQNKFDQALKLYEEINRNWKYYKETLKPDQTEPLIKLLDYMENFLKSKYQKALEKKKFLNMRKAYTKF